MTELLAKVTLLPRRGSLIRYENPWGVDFGIPADFGIVTRWVTSEDSSQPLDAHRFMVWWACDKKITITAAHRKCYEVLVW